MMSISRHHQTYPSTRSLSCILVTLVAVSGLYSCSSSSEPTTKVVQPKVSSGQAPTRQLPPPTSSAPINAQPSKQPLPTLEAPKSEPNSALDGKPQKNSGNNVTLPPDLAEPATPSSVSPDKPTQIPNTSTANKPQIPAAPSDSGPANPSTPSVASPENQPDLTSNLTEEAKQINQPTNPNLQLTPSSPSQASQPASATRSNRSQGLTSLDDQQTSSQSNSSGLRQPEYTYDPSTGVYTTESNGNTN